MLAQRSRHQALSVLDTAQACTLEDLLRRPHMHYPVLAAAGCGSVALSPVEQQCVEIDIKYAGFIKRQEVQLKQMAKKLHRRIPADFDYSTVGAMAMEAREKLAKFRPDNIGQASRLGGVNPADISALMVHLEVTRRKRVVADGQPEDAAPEVAALV